MRRKRTYRYNFISVSIYLSIYLSVILYLPRACPSINSLYVNCIIVSLKFFFEILTVYHEVTKKFCSLYSSIINHLLPKHHMNKFSNILLKGPSHQRRSALQRYIKKASGYMGCLTFNTLKLSLWFLVCL